MRLVATLLVVSACAGSADDMVPVPAGTFFMGCEPARDAQCEGDEQPGRMVDLTAFEIDVTEVTQAAWAACVADGACPLPAGDYQPDAQPDHPVVYVTWEAAAAHCAWAGKRLPTEAEWEKAARGSDGRLYPWGDAKPDCWRANTSVCDETPAPVAFYPDGASPFGVHDMAGNVMEWVADWYDPEYYVTAGSEDPTGPSTGTFRGKRGGSYYGDGETVRSSNRVLGFPVGLANLGLRCAR
jgi:formylglycine-generating enzyme required for sulfatase activity